MVSRRTFMKGVGQGVLALTCKPAVSLDRKTSAENKPFLIRLHCDGGWDPSMVFDPKVGINSVAQESGLTASTQNGITFGSHASRPNVDDFFSNQGDKTIILNGIYTGGMDHTSSMKASLGTRISTQSDHYTDYLTYLASSWNPNLPVPHTLFDLKSSHGEQTGSTMHFNENILNVLKSRSTSEGQMASSTEQALDSFLADSYQDTILTRPLKGLDAQKVYALYRGFKRDRSLRQAINGFYDSAHTAGQSNHLTYAKMSLQMMANDFTQCSSIRVGGHREWDTHTDHFNQQSSLYDDLFMTISTIISESAVLGIEDRLVIMVTSELGRSPGLNDDSGKNHWPYTSAMLWSPLINGGQTIGSTDSWMRGYTIDPETSTTSDQAGEEIPTSRLTNLTMGHVFCGLLNAFDEVYEPIANGTKPLLGMSS